MWGVNSRDRILVETAASKGVVMKKVEGKNRRFKMSYNKKSYLIRRGQVINAYNHSLALRLCRQKDLTNKYLIHRSFPAPDNSTFYKGDHRRAWGWAKDIRPVVLKPVSGSMGKMVFVNISRKREFIRLFKAIAEKYGKVLVEEHKQGADHRILVVNNKIVGILERVPANVKGDGKSTIKELILKKNEERKNSRILKKLKMDKETKRNLKQQRHSFSSVPKKEEVVFLRTNANISDGADSYEVQDKISDEVKETIIKAVGSIPGLRVAGVDVLIDGDDFHIIEINGNPMVSIHYETSCGQSKDVGEEVIKAMFPDL